LKRKDPFEEIEEEQQGLPGGMTNGQLCRTHIGYIQVWHIGKQLMDYKKMKQQGQMAMRS
jgi:hypothetical protein